MGGICGYLAGNATTVIENCTSAATVYGGGQYIGGICGSTISNANVRWCQNNGSVTGYQYVDGIVGQNNGNISGCRNNGIITSTTESTSGIALGGICGISNGTVTDCYNTGAVRAPASSNVGGVCGNNLKNITNAFNIGTVTGQINGFGNICGFGGPAGALSGCFYLGSDEDPGIGNGQSYKGTGTATSKSAAQFASGEVAYMLGTSFGQTLNTDAYPVFRSSDGSNAVYRLLYMNETQQHAAQYYNAGNTVSSAGISTPIKSGHYFSHWEGLPGSMPAGDVTVSAVFLPMDKTLISIVGPGAITGVANGTAKTAEALGLPSKVTLVTDGGDVQADVTWDVASCL